MVWLAVVDAQDAGLNLLEVMVVSILAAEAEAAHITIAPIKVVTVAQVLLLLNMRLITVSH